MDVYYHYTTARSSGVVQAYVIFEKLTIYVTMLAPANGPLAHLVERTHGMGEVTGSSPVWSTKQLETAFTGQFFLSGVRLAASDRWIATKFPTTHRLRLVCSTGTK